MNWSQLRTIIWLRWRLSRNQFARAGILSVVLGIIGFIACVIISVGSGIGGVMGGALGLSKASPLMTLFVWDIIIGAFLLFWLVGVISEIQRAESIDIPRLLHLPVSLKGVFVMNYLASLVTFSIIIFIPGVLGLCVGLLWGKGLGMILLVPLVLSFIFMITAWTYCLRGWLVAVMVNPRRRRNVILIATMTVVLLGQLPNLYFNVYLRHVRKVTPAATNAHGDPATPGESVDNVLYKNGVFSPAVVAAHNYVPILWLPKGAMALTAGNAWPAVWGSLGALLLGVAGLARAYRSTLRFYRGYSKDAPAKPRAATPVSAPSKGSFLEKQVPFVPEEVATLFLAFFRSLSRATEIKMLFFANFVVVIMAAAGVFSSLFKSSNDTFRIFMATGAVGFTFFGMIQVLFNQFGYDREAFRALVLLPVPRRHILLAKNLSFAPPIGLLGLSLLVVLAVLAHLPLLILLAACLQLVTMFLFISIAANFSSILVPYRVASGSMKAARPPAKTFILIFVTQLLFPVLVFPIFIPPLLGLLCEKMGWLSAAPVDALLSLLLLAMAVLLYRISLDSLGRFLEKREQKILLVVSHEAE
jgi:ABC-2 type transport system permease protein